MSAALARLRAAGRAASAFLNGFLGFGLGSVPRARVAGECAHGEHALPPTPTPDSVRAALAARSARRGNCC